MSEEDNKRLLEEIDRLDELEGNLDEKIGRTAVKNKIKIIAIVILLLFVVVILASSVDKEVVDDYITNNIEEKIEEIYDVGEYNNYEEFKAAQATKFEVLKEKVTVPNAFLSVNNELIAIVKNDNIESISDLKVQVIFYNGENKPIKIDESTIETLSASSEYYIKFYETPKTFERYDFLITQELYTEKNTEISKDSISYETNVRGINELQLKVKNNSNTEINEVELVVVYYDENDKILDINKSYCYDIKENKTQTKNIYLGIYKNDSYEDVPYSRYDILVNDISTY